MPPNASSCVAARQGSHFFWAEQHAEVAQFVSEVQGDRLREQGVWILGYTNFGAVWPRLVGEP